MCDDEDANIRYEGNQLGWFEIDPATYDPNLNSRVKRQMKREWMIKPYAKYLTNTWII